VLDRRARSLPRWREDKATRANTRPNHKQTTASPTVRSSSLAQGGCSRGRAWEPSFAATSAALPVRAKCCVSAARVAPAATPATGAAAAQSTDPPSLHAPTLRPCALRLCGAAHMTCGLCCAPPRVHHIRHKPGAGARPGQAARL